MGLSMGPEYCISNFSLSRISMKTSCASPLLIRIARAARDDKSEVRDMSEEQKKKVEGVLHEMKHMNAQQIEVMIAYMQGVAAAAKLMGAGKEE